MKNISVKKRSRRLKKSVKKRLILIGAVLILLIAIPVSIHNLSQKKPGDVGVVRVDRFRDLNALHLKHARQNGIESISRDKEVEEIAKQLIREKKLAKLEDTRYYKVDKLSHSHPYLTPETIDLLERIGKRFHEKLNERDMGKYRFRISSVLRTNESQKRLSRSNVNATSESAHLYGTTIDIGWKKIYKESFWGKTHLVADGPAIKVLSETIGELRKEGHLVVVTEMKEACFHITLVRK